MFLSPVSQRQADHGGSGVVKEKDRHVRGSDNLILRFVSLGRSERVLRVTGGAVSGFLKQQPVLIRFHHDHRPNLESVLLYVALHPHTFEPIRSFDKFLHVLCGLLLADETDRNPSRHREKLKPLTRIHFQFENHPGPIVGNALDQPITQKEARGIFKRLHEMTAIQSEPMAVRAPVSVWMIVEMVSEIGAGGWA